VRPLATIYWTRLALAIVSGAISTEVTILRPPQPGDVTTFLNGLTIALVVYLITYYFIKAKFKDKVEKQSKLMTQGIGIYFFAWLVSWILIYTIVLGQPPV
jgi:hypothetical protein